MFAKTQREIADKAAKAALLSKPVVVTQTDEEFLASNDKLETKIDSSARGKIKAYERKLKDGQYRSLLNILGYKSSNDVPQSDAARVIAEMEEACRAK